MRESEMMAMRQRRKIWKGLETARLASCSRYGHCTSYARQPVILQNREDETIVLIDFVHDVSSISFTGHILPDPQLRRTSQKLERDIGHTSFLLYFQRDGFVPVNYQSVFQLKHIVLLCLLLIEPSINITSDLLSSHFISILYTHSTLDFNNTLAVAT